MQDVIIAAGMISINLYAACMRGGIERKRALTWVLSWTVTVAPLGSTKPVALDTELGALVAVFSWGNITLALMKL